MLADRTYRLQKPRSYRHPDYLLQSYATETSPDLERGFHRSRPHIDGSMGAARGHLSADYVSTTTREGVPEL